MAAQYARIDMENSQGNESTTPGVFATPFYLPSEELTLNPQPQPLDRSNELHGVDARLPLAQNEYAPDGTARLRGYANYLGVLLMLAFGDVTTTPGNGVITDPSGATIPVGAYRHVFTKLSGTTPKSARVTLSYGSQWIQGRGVCCRELAFALDQDGVQATAALIANYVSRLTADPGFVPSQDAFSILPFRRRNVKVTLGAGTTDLESFGFTLAQDLEAVHDLGSFTGFPTETERNNDPKGFLGATGTFTRRQFDTDDWDHLITCQYFSIVAQMQSEQFIGTTSYPYSMWFQAPYAQAQDGNVEGLKHQPRHQDDITWQAGYDDQALYDFKVTLVNGTPLYK